MKNKNLFLSKAKEYLLYYLNKLTNYKIEREIFRKKTGYKPNLKDPKSFNEKIIYKKRKDRNPLLPITADKERVRKYIKKVLGKEEAEKILIPLIHVTDKPETIPFEKLPKNFIIKANHASGRNIIVRDGKFDKKEIIKKCKEWLKMPYRLGKLEWAYQPIKRKIIIEKLITDKNGNIPRDYKFFVFNGKCKLVQIDFDRRTKDKEHTRSLYDGNWNYIDASLKYPQGKRVKKPTNFNEMKSLAEKLGNSFNFIRADFYSVGEKIRFGEITHYPGSGREYFKPKLLDFELGKEWDLK